MSSFKWLQEKEQELMALWPQRELSVKDIAERFGVTESAVRCKARKLKLPNKTNVEGKLLDRALERALWARHGITLR